MPFTSLAQAFSAVINPTPNVLQFDQIRFFLSSDSAYGINQPYSTEIQALATGVNTYFSIERTNPPPNPQDCSSYPYLKLSDLSSISISSEDLDTALDPSSTFIFQYITLLVSASTTMNQYLLFQHSHYTVSFLNVCIREETAAPLPIMLQSIDFQNIPVVNINDLIVLNQSYTVITMRNITSRIDLANISIVLDVLPSDLTSVKAQSTFSVFNDEVISEMMISNISFQCDPEKLSSFHLPQLFNISNQLSVDLSLLTIQDCSLTLLSDFVAISNSTSINLQSVMMQNITLDTRTSTRNSSILFKLIDSLNYSISSVIFFFSNFTYTNVPRSYAFDFFYFSSVFDKPTFQLNSLWIMNTNFIKAYNRIMNINIVKTLGSLSISDVLVQGSEMNIRALFRVVIPSSSTILETINWREVSNLNLAYNTFSYCYILEIDGTLDSFIPLTEKEFYSLSNWQIVGNLFQQNEDELGDAFLTTKGAFLKMSSLVFVENILNSHDGIGVRLNPCNFLLLGATISNNQFIWSIFYRNNIFADAAANYFIDVSFFTPDNYVKRENRAFIGYNLNVINNTFTKYSVFVTVSAPTFALYKCTFAQNRFLTQDDALIDILSYTPLNLEAGYAGFIPDPVTENKIYDGTVVLDLLNGQTLGSQGIPTEQVHRYIIEDVVFDSSQFTNGVKSILFRELNFPACGIHFYNVAFLNHIQDSITSFSIMVDISKVPYVRVENCTFSQIIGNGVLLNIQDLILDGEFIFKDNMVSTLRGVSIIRLASESINTLQISSNTFMDLTTNQTLFIIDIQVLGRSLEFSENLISNVEIYSSSLTATMVNLLQINVETSRYGENTTFIFFDSKLANVFMDITNEFITGVFSNSIFLIAGAQGLLNMTKMVFENITVTNLDPMIKGSSSGIVIDTCQFSDINASSSTGIISLVFKTFQVKSSNFRDLILPVTDGGPLFYIASSSSAVAKVFSIVNCSFEEIISEKSTILAAQSLPLNLTIQRCTFTNVYVLNNGILYFYRVNFVSFVFSSVTAFFSSSNSTEFQKTGSLLYVSQCQMRQSALAEVSHVKIDTHNDLSGAFLTIIGGISLPMVVTNFTMKLDPNVIQVVKISYSILDALDASITFTNLTISNLTSNGTHLFQVGCSQGTGSSLTISQSNFETIFMDTDRDNPTSSHSPSLIFVDSTSSFCPHQIKISNSNFSHITSTGNGTIFQNIQTPLSKSLGIDSLIIEESTFEFIEGVYGGVIYSQSNSTAHSLIQIISSIFKHNYATRVGGVLYLDATDLNLIDSAFHNNTAAYNGGAIHIDLPLNVSEILSLGNVFTENKALLGFGNDFASHPSAMKIIFHEPALSEQGVILNGSKFKNVSTRSLQTVVTEVHLLDKFDQIYNDLDPQKTVAFYFDSSFQSRVFTYRNCTSSECLFIPDNLEFSGKANEVISLKIEYQSMAIFTNQIFDVELRACVVGEINTTATGTCELCPLGKYSLNISDEYCRNCMEGADCLGGNNINVFSGWWRSNTSSSNLTKCTNGKCIGGTGENLCDVGYTGPLCEQCDHNLGYTYVSNGGCVICSTPTGQQIFALILGILGLSGYQLLLAFIMYNSNIAFSESFKATGERAVKLGHFIGLFTSYTQIASIILSLDSSLLSSVEMADTFGNPTKLTLLASECLFARAGFSAFESIRIKIILTNIEPIAKWILFCLLVWPFQKLIKKKMKKSRMDHFSGITFLSLFLLQQPGIIRSLLGVFKCIILDPDSEDTYNMTNLDVVCNTTEYIGFKNRVVWPLVLTWGVIIPILLAAFMQFNQRRMRTESYRIVLGGLYNQYTQEACHWGLISLVSKEVLNLTNSLLSTEEDTNAILVVMILAVYYWLLKRNKPYHHKLLYDLDIYPTACTAWSVLLILLKKHTKIYALQLISTYTLVVSNALVVVYFFLRGGTLMLAQANDVKAKVLDCLKKVQKSLKERLYVKSKATDNTLSIIIPEERQRGNSSSTSDSEKKEKLISIIKEAAEKARSEKATEKVPYEQAKVRKRKRGVARTIALHTTNEESDKGESHRKFRVMKPVVPSSISNAFDPPAQLTRKLS